MHFSGLEGRAGKKPALLNSSERDITSLGHERMQYWHPLQSSASTEILPLGEDLGLIVFKEGFFGTTFKYLLCVFKCGLRNRAAEHPGYFFMPLPIV